MTQSIWEYVYQAELNKVKYLLDNGANPNETRYSFSLLMISCACDNKYTTRLLLDHGANIDQVVDGKTVHDYVWSEKIRDILKKYTS